MPDSSLDQPLAKGRSRWMRWTNPSRGATSKSDTSGRVAEAIARFSGTPTFLIWLTVFVFVWMAWNSWGNTTPNARNSAARTRGLVF